MLEMIDIYLSQVKNKTNNDIAILNNLALIIFIGDFYQFHLVTGRFLLTDAITKKEIYSKSI